MTEVLPSLVAVIVAALSGGALAEAVRAFRDRKTSALDTFYPTWQQEQKRMLEEIRLLRHVVVALAQKLEEIGIDSLEIRLAVEENLRADNRPPPTPQHPERA